MPNGVPFTRRIPAPRGSGPRETRGSARQNALEARFHFVSADPQPHTPGVGVTGGSFGDYCLPVSMRVLRLMLALPVMMFVANCSRACRWAVPDGDFRFAYSAYTRIR